MRTVKESGNEKLMLVLERICERLGSVNKTQAVKLPYLAEAISSRVLGHPMTDAAYETWQHGVVCRPLYQLLTDQGGCGRFHVEPRAYVEDEYTVSLPVPATASDGLTAAELAIVDHVVDEFGDMTARELGLLTKRMNPTVAPTGWGRRQAADVSENAYERLTPAYQEMVAQFQTISLGELREGSTTVDDPRDWV